MEAINNLVKRIPAQIINPNSSHVNFPKYSNDIFTDWDIVLPAIDIVTTSCLFVKIGILSNESNILEFPYGGMRMVFIFFILGSRILDVIVNISFSITIDPILLILIEPDNGIIEEL